LYELTAYNKWERRFFLPGAAPRVMVMHGDYFDWVERKISARLRDIAVYLFSQGRKATSEVLGMMQELSRKENAAKDYTSHIQRAAPAQLGSMQAGNGTVPAEFNVQRKDTTIPNGLLFLDTAIKECAGTNLKTVIIGHTHHARIAVGKAPDGTPFTLIDTGAWIENCVEAGGGAVSPNAQITALSADQVRIYQLDRKK
jgi:UDP-2,3-diacylglucosamine pyrophosphatase LpxH